MKKITIVVEDDSDAWKAHRMLEEARREKGQEKIQQQDQEQEEKRLSTSEILALLNEAEAVLDNADSRIEHLTKD